MQFEQFVSAARLSSKDTNYFKFVAQWDFKRQALQVQIADIPMYVAEFKRRKQWPNKEQPHITMFDQVPSIRLGNACIGLTNGLYSMADVAAKFTSIATKSVPSSFNKLRDKAEKDLLDDDLTAWLGDLKWYRKVREIRTEWEHHSHIFVAGNKSNEPLIVVQAYRRSKDCHEFPERTVCSVDELLHWVEMAIRTLDNLGIYMLKTHVVPIVKKAPPFKIPKFKPDGMPVISDSLFEVEEISGEEYLRRLGIDPSGDDGDSNNSAP